MKDYTNLIKEKIYRTKKLSYIITIFIVLGFYKQYELISQTNNEPTNKKVSIENILADLKDSDSNKIMVVAHSGDWRNAPENSLQAIKNCINMGIDMVEIDVRKTKDGKLVLMHDKTLNRTTTGKGLISDWTLKN